MESDKSEIGTPPLSRSRCNTRDRRDNTRSRSRTPPRLRDVGRRKSRRKRSSTPRRNKSGTSDRRSRSKSRRRGSYRCSRRRDDSRYRSASRSRRDPMSRSRSPLHTNRRYRSINSSSDLTDSSGRYHVHNKRGHRKTRKRPYRPSSSDSNSSPVMTHKSRRVSSKKKHRSPSKPATENTLVEKLVTALNERNNTASPGAGLQAAQNVIPDFDPQAKTQTMKDWLSKINESAHVYGWSERQTIYCALPRLKGLAKQWYDGLTSVKFTWAELQEQLLEEFSIEENYGDMLFEMLTRKTRRNETPEQYYYDKMLLINRCELRGKKAVHCLTNGIVDPNIKMNVQGANLQEPAALDGINEDIEAYLVEPGILPADILIGQSLTELPQIRIHKTDDRLLFYKDVVTGHKKLSLSNPNDELISDSRPESARLTVNLISQEAEPTANAILLDQINVDDDLDSKTKEKLCEVLNSKRDCFAFTLEELGKTSLTQMHIELKDDIPVTYRPYRLSMPERAKVNDIVDNLLTNGIIRESQSEYASPIILVAKKNGEKRLCVDYRALNRKTVKEKFPMPLVDDQIDSLSEQVYFTTLDLTSGYHQVPVAEESKHVTAFVTPDGHFEYNRMPFGLTNAPAVFQRLVLTLLRRQPIPGVLAYMDDIIIPSKTIDEGMEKLIAVLNLLKEANLTLNLSKCHFFKSRIDYLGFEISSDGVKPGLKKTEAVAAFKTPQNVHEVRQFVGLASFFRRFVPGFASIARPLTSLTKNNVAWSWGEEQSCAFSRLKEILVTRPVLAIYNHKYETELHTDASLVGLGGILLQRPNKESPFRAVAYFSRQTTAEEQHYHSYELETLAVVASLSRFRVYLLGLDFKVVTDCNALRTTLTRRDLIPRIARWWLLVQEFTFTIEYRPGAQLAHADALSRNPVQENRENIEIVMQVGEVHWLQSVQLSDPRLCHIKAVLDTKCQEAKDIQQNYTLKDGKIYRKVDGELRWAVPRDARWKIMQQCHDQAGHFSYVKTLEKVKRDYWFPRMTQFIKKYVRACIPCAHAKGPGGKREGLLHPIPKPNVPFQCLHIDHLGPFVKSKRGNIYILGIIDSFTKFVILKAVKNTKSKTSISALKDVFALFGTPRNLISDRGTSFTSAEFKSFMETAEVKHTLNAVATPRANGQIERYNRSILSSLTVLCHGDDDRDWDEKLSQVQWSLNNTINQGTGKTPAEVVFGKSTVNMSEGHLHETNENHDVPIESIERIREEVVENINSQQEKMKSRYDSKRCKAKIYKVGDLVMVQKSSRTPGESNKLTPSYSGPYRVTAAFDHDRYEEAKVPASYSWYPEVRVAKRGHKIETEAGSTCKRCPIRLTILWSEAETPSACKRCPDLLRMIWSEAETPSACKRCPDSLIHRRSEVVARCVQAVPCQCDKPEEAHLGEEP
ncbi:unnamed protein product [Plutella xylostella]|uniref:RNA-directed DNA polymerase n=1 Tax=Plutella xylostella TaxID=51655 RepID=A0A8S4EFP5_PLUXY|nr:unnamed protein product [Plutella xylostella]